MRIIRSITVAAVALSATLAQANNDPARFWLSASNSSPIISEAPTIAVPLGRARTLYIWAQPGTDNAGNIRPILDFSLDIVTQGADLVPEPQPFVDFLDGTTINNVLVGGYRIYNPIVNAPLRRFQFTTDSLRAENSGGALLSEKSAVEVAAGQPDAIKGLQGLSTELNQGVGIGQSNDPMRFGSAWLLGEFQLTSLQSTRSNLLFLQVGYAGIVSQGSTATQVMLGNNVTPLYDASNVNQRQKNLVENLVADTYDVRINAVPFSPGDYDSDGVIGPSDYTFWRNAFGQVVTPGSGADGNGNGSIDAADYVFWRQRVMGGGVGSGLLDSSTGLAAWGNAIPEPTSSVMLLLLIAWAWFARDVRTA